MIRRTIRYQAAIVRDHHVLLLRVHDHIGSGEIFWVLPGGGQEPGETAEDCVRREVREETSLEVRVERMLFATPDGPGGLYDHLHTYLCTVVAGSAAPGIEPEVDTPEKRSIQEVGWFDLREPLGWDELVRADAITSPLLMQLRAALGYAG